MIRRLPGQAGNVRKTCTTFGHGGSLTAPHRATHLIYAAAGRRRHAGRSLWGLVDYHGSFC